VLATRAGIPCVTVSEKNPHTVLEKALYEFRLIPIPISLHDDVFYSTNLQ